MTDIEKAEYEDVLRRLTAKCEELVAENTRLRSEKSDALSVCKEVYSDPKADPALRLRAAGLALPHETPRLTPQPPPPELVANVDPDSTLPLAELVAKRRARHEQLMTLSLEQRSALITGVSRSGGNGDDTGG
jgi:hypothetical protein